MTRYLFLFTTLLIMIVLALSLVSITAEHAFRR